MAFDCYMFLEGPNGGAALPEGETSDAVYKDKKAFEVYSFSFGASNPVTLGSGTGGGGAGRVSISSFNVMKRTDKASPKLFAACCAGAHFNKATVALRKSGPESSKAGGVYIEYVFHKVFIESIQWSGSSGGDDYPTESLSFAFGAVEIGYLPQKADGTLGTKVPATWSVIKNDNTTNVE